ncbi:hypothetical protein B0T19DRAFT_477748 [Cercophora scortea]|uniref:AGC-kinase C-terminal domain-containing protein n=1 Tax=Cercophora scortea TaxID=314031 RepID=A0AAE0I8J7_9PEZI|nr:hypothetical protein B0T19DRAFT_477748 [Cercophora scortea]
MLSHLRFHRRNGVPSTPTSPSHDQQPAAAAAWEPGQDGSPLSEMRPRSSNSAHAPPLTLPPTLPPIARVTSADPHLSPEPRDDIRPVSQDSRTAPGRSTHGFMGGLGLQGRRWTAQGTQRTEPTEEIPHQRPDSHLSRTKPAPPPITTVFTSRPAQKAPPSFVTPTDLQQSAGGVAGKRPAGTRLTSEPAPSTTPISAPEAHKGKRSLPFLKNPMSSLLMRRKTSQPAPDIQPPPFQGEPSYDPRIRGTKVHDFSAPRPKRGLSSTEAAASSAVNPDPTRQAEQSISAGGPGSESIASSRRLSGFDPNQQRDPVSYEPLHSTPSGHSKTNSTDNRPFSVSKPLPEPPVPSVPEEASATSVRTSSSSTTRAPSRKSSILPSSSSSVKTARSFHRSLSGISARESVRSGIPRHMKSTSSRFSFDMVGAANQEKVLEERHRQREQEKKTTDVTSGSRDSRFDDFDDDSFDYDAMMDDDGLEERIPGVNTDLEEDYGLEERISGINEELEDEVGLEESIPGINEDLVEDDYSGGAPDPDDDQENFAGFVFQRSQPATALPSPLIPGALETPRDADGTVIGFAMTIGTTPDQLPSPLPVFPTDTTAPPKMDDAEPGLGIHVIDAKNEVAQGGSGFVQDIQDGPVGLPRPRATPADDIYFDDGLADELDFEHDGTVFDESIFDMIDTDKYGRPIPGAFARAKEAMQTTQTQNPKIDSEMTSRLSAQSGLSQSTAHTSLSTGLPGLQHPPIEALVGEDGALSAEEAPNETQEESGIPGQDLVYQAALAEAAQKAAASGKFRRSSTPPLPAELTITSPTDSSESLKYSGHDASLDDYENDYDDGLYGANLDDSDFDDEAIIAEANASALANDSDGFYGQEFGFYSQISPMNGASNALNAENLFHYANGGYFGPAGQGISRTASGRVVSREPNLTPITERSEYSNRNSIMSLGLPANHGSEGRSVQSPGLAQLALLADDDSMNLAALRKLRSKAWGGSQTSLVSSREGSPRSERATPAPDGSNSPWNVPGSSLYGIVGPQQQHTHKNSAYSVWSNSDAGASGSGSPTYTVPMTLPPMSGSQSGVKPLVFPTGNSAGNPSLQQSYSPSALAPPPTIIPSARPANIGMACPPLLEEVIPAAEPSPAAPASQPPSVLGEPPIWNKSPTQIFESYDERQEQSSSNTTHTVSSPASPMTGTTTTTTTSASSPLQTRASAPVSRPGVGHRHKGSADSISYSKEEEESGGTRWVMERRRTAESGEVEILEREVVEGGGYDMDGAWW